MPTTFNNEKYPGMNFVYFFHNKDCRTYAVIHVTRFRVWLIPSQEWLQNTTKVCLRHVLDAGQPSSLVLLQYMYTHYATNRQVVGPIPDGVIGIFQWHDPSGHTTALGSIQPLIEMSTRCISWGKRRPVRKADNLTTILCLCHEIWEP